MLNQAHETNAALSRRLEEGSAEVHEIRAENRALRHPVDAIRGLMFSPDDGHSDSSSGRTLRAARPSAGREMSVTSAMYARL